MITFLQIFLYVIGQMFILGKITDRKLNWKSFKVYGLIILGVLLLYIFSLDFLSCVRSIGIILFLLLITIFIFSIPVTKAFGVVFFDFYIGMIIEIGISLFLMTFVGQMFFRNSFLLFFSQIVILLGTYCSFNISFIKKIKDEILCFSSYKFYVFLLFALGGYSVLLFSSFLGKITFFSGLVLSFFILCCLGISFYGLFLELSQYRNVSKKYDLLLETIHDYEKLLEKERMMCHENKNQLMILRSLISSKKAISYIDALLKEEVSKIDFNYANSLVYLPFEGMRGLFYYKYFAAQKLGVCLNLEVGKSVEDVKDKKINMDSVSALLKVMGVFLDNALEGARISSLKEVDVTFYQSGKELYITVANSFASNMDLSKGVVGTTTKGENHGYGLLLVQKILKEHKFLKNKTEVISNVFVQTIVIDLEKM